MAKPLPLYLLAKGATFTFHTNSSRELLCTHVHVPMQNDVCLNMMTMCKGARHDLLGHDTFSLLFMDHVYRCMPFSLLFMDTETTLNVVQTDCLNLNLNVVGINMIN